MAASIISKVRHDVWGRRRVRLVTFKFSTSYPTGGEPLSAHQCDLAEINAVFVSPQAVGYVVTTDATRTHLIAYQQTAATSALIEVSNATDLSAIVVDLLVVGF